jgi:ubiquinone biosynthesis protein
VVQPQLVLLQKTLLNIEGLGRQLYPDLDLWRTAKPFLEGWMSEHAGAHALLNTMKSRMPDWLGQLAHLPDLAFETLQRVHQEKLRLEWHSTQLDELRGAVRRANRRTVGAVIGGALLISAALLYGLDHDSARRLAGVPLLAWLSGIPGLAALAWAWLQKERD